MRCSAILFISVFTLFFSSAETFAAKREAHGGDCKIQSIFLDLATKQLLQLTPESRPVPSEHSDQDFDVSDSAMTFGFVTGVSEPVFLDTDLEVLPDLEANKATNSGSNLSARLILKMRIGKNEVATSLPDVAPVGTNGATVTTSVVLSEQDALRAGFPSLAGKSISELEAQAIPDHTYLWIGFRMNCAVK